jgi:hypothetical protein
MPDGVLPEAYARLHRFGLEWGEDQRGRDARTMTAGSADLDLARYGFPCLPSQS